jgi:DNA-binding NarL/FixJ family response regulator
VVVIDAVGVVSAALATANLGVPILNVRHRRDLGDLTGIGLVVIAAYEAPIWTDVAALAATVPTVVVASPARAADARTAIGAMAFGYLSAALAPEAMRRSIKGALRGQPAYARDVLGHWITDQLAVITPEMKRTVSLTPRQRDVIRLVARGASDKQIGRTLGITTGTAQKHVTNLLKRLGAPNRAAAVAQIAVIDFWNGSAPNPD